MSGPLNFKGAALGGGGYLIGVVIYQTSVRKFAVFPGVSYLFGGGGEGLIRWGSYLARFYDIFEMAGPLGIRFCCKFWNLEFPRKSIFSSPYLDKG